jgi:hypothetical protein
MATTDNPDRFYKFGKREHAEAMCARGVVRVGTLYEYRDAERYKGGVLDQGEGIIRAIDHLDHVTSENMHEHSPDAQRWFGRLREHVVVDGIAVVADKRQCSDFYIYCVSDTSDWSAASDTKYDTCVEITEPVRFFQIIANALSFATGVSPLPGVIRKVQYSGRDYDWREKPPTAPEVLKEPQYQHQREWRGIFGSPWAFKCPVILRIPALARCVRLVATRP